MGKHSTYPTIAGQHHTTHEPAGEDVVVGIAPAAHAVTHILAGVDPIVAALDARAIALTAQGEIVYHAAAANTLAVLAVGVAGQALLSGGPAANVSWGAPTPAAHVLATTGPHTNELPLTDLAAGVRGNLIQRGAADWEVVAVGAIGQALLSGGAGADNTWGAPAPAAHEATHVAGGADDIDAALDGRAIGFSEQGDIVYASGATTLAALVHGNAGQALLSGGHGANPSWGAPAPVAHEATHVAGGADDIDSALDARALAFVNQGEIVYRAAAANTLAVLAPGTVGEYLETGGAGANPSWDAADRGETIIVAASTSLDVTKAKSIYRCSGAADNVEINAALVAAAAVNGSVMLLEGTYNTILTLSVAINVTLKATGWGAVINFNAGGNAITITGNNVKLKDFKVVIAAGAGAGGTRPNCIFADTRSNLEISGIWGVGDVTVADDGSEVRQCGIVFDTVTHSRISGCHLETNDRHGIILIASSDNNTITGNICNNNEERGIRIDTSAVNTVTDNVCESLNNIGIHIYTSTDNIVTGNICNNNSGHGIYVSSTSVDNTITGNTCNNNENAGIQLYSDCDDNTVTGNTCNSNTFQGMRIYQSLNNTITGNTCSKNVQHGIYIHASHGSTITGNTCFGNDSGDSGTFDGISINGGDRNVVVGNNCQANDRWGIYLESAEYNKVGLNYTNGNGSGSIRVQNAGCLNTTVEFNTVEEGAPGNAGTNTRSYGNYDPSANAFVGDVGVAPF